MSPRRGGRPRRRHYPTRNAVASKRHALSSKMSSGRQGGSSSVRRAAPRKSPGQRRCRGSNSRLRSGTSSPARRRGGQTGPSRGWHGSGLPMAWPACSRYSCAARVALLCCTPPVAAPFTSMQRRRAMQRLPAADTDQYRGGVGALGPQPAPLHRRQRQPSRRPGRSHSSTTVLGERTSWWTFADQPNGHSSITGIGGLCLDAVAWATKGNTTRLQLYPVRRGSTRRGRFQPYADGRIHEVRSRTDCLTVSSDDITTPYHAGVMQRERQWPDLDRDPLKLKETARPFVGRGT